MLQECDSFSAFFSLLFQIFCTIALYFMECILLCYLCLLLLLIAAGRISCTIQNSVVCAGATIESNCNLNECYIGSSARILAGSRMKSETVSCRS